MSDFIKKEMKKINTEDDKKNDIDKKVYIDKLYIDFSPTKNVNLRIEEKIYDKIKAEANSLGISIKTYVLYSCLSNIKDNKEIFTVDEKNLENLIFQVRKIGININQIARKINSGELKEINFDKFSEDFKNIEEQIYTFKSKIRKVR